MGLVLIAGHRTRRRRFASQVRAVFFQRPMNVFVKPTEDFVT
jgi:hypothetical protein